MLEEMRDLLAYDDWANGRTLEAVRALTKEQLERELPSSFPSVLATLQHVFGAEAVWLRRWLGSSSVGWPDDLRADTLSELEVRWADLARQRRDWAARLTDDDVRADLAYTNLRGEPFAHPLAEQIRHAVNHSTYHRGQVVTMLHLLGAAAVGTDLITFYRSRPDRV